MMTSRRAIFALWVVTTLSAGGCRSSRKTPAPPTAPALAPAPAAAAPQPPPPAPLLHPPKPTTAPAAAHPPPPVRAKHPPNPRPEPAEAPAAPPPAFGQILTPQQQTEFRRSYRQSAEFARQTLSQLLGRPLSRDQADTANRVRSFLSQADETQSKDPSAAAQLARRAEL